MAGGAAEVDQPAFGQHEDCVAVREDIFIDLRLNGDLLNTRDVHERVDLDFVVKMTDVAHDSLVFHSLHMFDGNDVPVPGGGDIDIGLAEGVLNGLYLVSFHSRLERADWIDFGYCYPGAHSAE